MLFDHRRFAGESVDGRRQRIVHNVHQVRMTSTVKRRTNGQLVLLRVCSQLLRHESHGRRVERVEAVGFFHDQGGRLFGQLGRFTGPDGANAFV